MNKTNRALMGTLLGIALVYVAICYIETLETLMNNIDGDRTIVFVPSFIAELILPYINISDFAVLDAMHDAYWELADMYTQFTEDEAIKEYLIPGLVTLGFVLVVAGCVSKPTRDLKGSEDDPQEYLFTHRPKAAFKCIMIPWNILVAAWNKKKVPVILPIIFIPFMLPFALMADAILIVLFAIVWAVMKIRIRSASKKDRETYERITQYAVCPKCKRKFYQPDIKCACDLMISYPVPDVHGIKFHTCNNGHYIPSTNKDGARAQLNAVCPHCKENIATHEAKPIVISLAGPMNSGKTVMMLSAVEELTAKVKGKGIVSEIVTKGISVEAQRAKSRVSPTPPGESDTEQFFMRARDMPEKNIMINDISGAEFLPDEDKILFEEYYRYNRGVIFAIDPLEMMALYHSRSPTKGSKDTPAAVFESFHYMYSEINGYGPSAKSNVPLAIVLTKMDDPRVRNAINAEGSPRDFLKKYEGSTIIGIAESAFKNVKYFAISSLGEDTNAADPFQWILSESDTDLKSKLS